MKKDKDLPPDERQVKKCDTQMGFGIFELILHQREEGTFKGITETMKKVGRGSHCVEELH